jgi:hypothetical protein
MPTQILVGETVNFTAQFLDYNDITDDEVVIDPDSVDGHIYKYNSTTSTYEAFSDFTPNEPEDGLFQFDWTTTEAGKFQVDFVAHIGINQEVTNSRFIFIGDIVTTDTLGVNVTYYFLGVLDPLYLDPEIVLTYFPEGDLVELTELIYWYSNELLYLTNSTSITDITPLMQDYILASVLCDLSKIYTFSGGMGGFSSSDSFTLGDLSVKSSTGSSSSSSGNGRGNVSNWCELAALLRAELIGSKNGMKAIVKGSNFCNPIPCRRIRRID